MTFEFFSSTEWKLWKKC